MNTSPDKPDHDKSHHQADHKKPAPPINVGKQPLDDLDEALSDSFPASDPPSHTSTGTVAPKRPHEKDKD